MWPERYLYMVGDEVRVILAHCFINRLGEPTRYLILLVVLIEPRTHTCWYLGPTGSGKTATLVSMLMHTMAVHKPRIFLVTALPTFYLLGDYFREQGLTVNHVQFTAKAPALFASFC